MKQSNIVSIILIVILGMAIKLYPQVLLTHNYTIDNGLVSNNINSLCQDSSGYIWIASSEGLSVYDSQDFRSYTIENGLPTNDLFYVIADKRDGNKIWIGSIGKGVIEYNKGKFISFGENLPPPKRNVNCLFMDDKGRLWCGTDNSIYLIKNNKIIELQNPLKINSVNSISGYNNGSILIGASNGFFTFIPSKNKFIKNKLPQRGNQGISSVKYIGNNTILVLTTKGRLFKIKDKNVSSVLLSSIGTFHRIFNSKSQNIFWITSDHG